MPGEIPGAVRVTEGGRTVARIPLDDRGRGQLTTSLPAGEHQLRAVYAGTATVLGSSSEPATVTAEKVASGLKLVQSTGTSRADEPVTFTASVSGPVGTPVGTVSFYDADSIMGTVKLVRGRAAYRTSALAAGRHRITAVFHGDQTYAQAVTTLRHDVGRRASR